VQSSLFKFMVVVVHRHQFFFYLLVPPLHPLDVIEFLLKVNIYIYMPESQG